ncbi:hypothetical protein Q7P37_005104 [Cladosporium fusiforme]
MAAEGTTERACDRCRERRVKCDKRHPACFRCEKLGKPCPGYDKKRKFVDEGATLRRKYEGEASRGPAGCELSDLSLNSPRSTLAGASNDSPDPSNTRRRRNPSEQSTPNFRQDVFRADQPKGEANPQIFKPDPVPLPIHSNMSHFTQQSPSLSSAAMDLDGIMNDTFDASQFDPAWFDLEPDDFYGKNNNSCGFIPNLPIVDEVDKPEPRPSIEAAFGTPISGLGLDGVDIGNLWAPETQLHTSQIITDEREHEMAFLIRHFSESLGPWMDLFDCEKHFAQLVPLKALRDALLKNSIAAVAAKQLGRVRGNKPFLGRQNQKPATMEVIQDGMGVDWFYKAANYYDKAIMYSRLYLQALSGSLSNPPSPATSATLTTANSDDLLLAVSIFSLYESLDNAEAGWTQHLTGMKSLLSVVSPATLDSQIPLETSLERRASFWNFARADYQAAYINHTPTLLDTDDIVMWQGYGLQISPKGSLYFDPEGLKLDPCHRCSTVQLVAHTLLWILLRATNFLASPAQDVAIRQTTWAQINADLNTWHSCLPIAFQPSAQLRHPVSRRGSATPGGQPSIRTGIRELFFSIPLCAATMQLYHFARIILLISKPTQTPTSSRLQAYREVSTLALQEAHEIVGIALGRPHPAVRVEMLLPLFAAGSLLEADDERLLVVEILRAIELDTGCATENRVRDLEREWGWKGSELAVAVAA